MAAANQKPILDVQAGMAALDIDLPRVLRLMDAETIEQVGWMRPNKLSLLVPMFGERNGQRENYLLRLAFQAYRKWPPSAQFVNPTTHSYEYPKDQHHVPQLTSPECHTHVAYQRTPQNPKIQLICCSATLEFYDVLHDIRSDDHIWRETDTFYTTIVAIQKAFGSHYQGRFPVHGQ